MDNIYGIQGLEADARRTHGGPKEDTRRTNCGDVARAPSRRTHGGQARGTRPEHIPASLFSSKREPHRKLFGEQDETS